MANPGAAQLGTAAASALLPGTVKAPLLPAPRSRELADDELRSLLANAAPEHLPLLVGLLSGLTPAALIALRVANVTLKRNLTIPGEPGRVLPIEGPLRDLTTLRATLPVTPSVLGAAVSR
jgi:hypothetical protein